MPWHKPADRGPPRAVTLINSTVSGNSGATEGGGINAGTVTLTNSTISGNTTLDGGGIDFISAATLTNSTVSGNTATTYGGGVYSISGGLTLTNSIIADNTTNIRYHDCYTTGTVTASHTLVETAGDCGVTAGTNGNLNGDPSLSALADNGCATPAGAPGSFPGECNAGVFSFTATFCNTNSTGGATPVGLTSRTRSLSGIASLVSRERDVSPVAGGAGSEQDFLNGTLAPQGCENITYEIGLSTRALQLLRRRVRQRGAQRALSAGAHGGEGRRPAGRGRDGVCSLVPNVCLPDRGNPRLGSDRPGRGECPVRPGRTSVPSTRCGLGRGRVPLPGGAT